MSWSNKLECSSLTSISSLLLCNTLAYWADSISNEENNVLRLQPLNFLGYLNYGFIPSKKQVLMGQIRVDSGKVISLLIICGVAFILFVLFKTYTVCSCRLAHSVIFNYVEQASLLRAGRSRQQM